MWQPGWQNNPDRRPDHRGAIGRIVGLWAVILSFYMLLGMGHAGVGIGALMPLLVMIGVFLVVLRLIGGAVGQTASLPADPRAIHEKAALRAAARNHGYITPAELVLESRGLSISDAKELLDQLTGEGWCEVDADENGRLVYHFEVGRKHTSADDLSAEEWVEAASARMRGTDDEDTESVRQGR